MFSQISLKSFAYDLIDVFCFSMEEVRKIYDQYDIIKCHMYFSLFYLFLFYFSQFYL